MAVDITEDTAANKIPMEAQFQKFVEAGAQQGRPKKVKSTNTSTTEKCCWSSVDTPTPIPHQNDAEDTSKAPINKPGRHMQECYAGHPKGEVRSR